MLRIIQTKSSAGAKSYYSKSDYLSEGQELTGIWNGKAAQMLGLNGIVNKIEFDRLCDNQHPKTGEQLTLRNREGRTVGYDFNFHVPKGLSVAYELLGDERILLAFNRAVDETMEEIEQDAATRVRKHYGNLDRNVRNLAWAKFVHKTARPVDGVPDPHLHAHCFVQNVVFDDVENAWKAGQFRDIKRDAPYFEAAFHARLANNIKALGYEIERRGKNWDIAQVPEKIAAKFSTRTELIEELAKEQLLSLEQLAAKKGLTVAEMAKQKGVSIEELARQKAITDALIKSELGASSRESKVSDLSMNQLRKIWRERLTVDDLESIGLPNAKVAEPQQKKNAEAMRYAIEHSFERSSVIPTRKLLAEALRYGVGAVGVEEMQQELEKQQVIVRELGKRSMATTPKVLAEERAMIQFVKDGCNSLQPIVNDYVPKREWLNKDQSNAVKLLLASKDRVVVIQGGAGTGKTTLMSEAVEAIEATGIQVHTFAPSAEASRGVLASEGFKATTVSELMVNQKLQGEVAGTVLWIDEAGLLSAKQLKAVLDIADHGNCRVVLSGDPNQHKSVERGDVLQLLEREKAVEPILVEKIKRQKGDYKQAVEHLARGNTERGIDELENLGWIHAIGDNHERLTSVAKQYADQQQQKQSTLVVSPTHAEADAVTKAIREELKARNLLGNKAREFKRLVPKHLTTAEKSDPTNIESDDYLVFHQNCPGIIKGTTKQAEPDLARKAIQYPDRYSVFRESDLELAKSDKIRITKSGKTLDGKHRVYNGNVFQIKSFDRKGNIVLQNGWKLDKDYGHLALGYVSTSHSSQGKTVDNVIVVESFTSFPAAGRDQLYVSISRGRKRASIFTDDIDEFRAAVQRNDQRVSATELLSEGKKKKRRHQQLTQRIENEYSRETKRQVEIAPA